MTYFGLGSRMPTSPPNKMKTVNVFSIPKGVPGYFNVLSDVEVWTVDAYVEDLWKPARLPFLGRSVPLIEVPEVRVEGTASDIKDIVNELMFRDGYYAILSRHARLFGIAYAKCSFVHPQQDFVIPYKLGNQ